MWKQVIHSLSLSSVSTPWIAGHGPAPVPVSFTAEASRLAALSDPTHLIGYSLGGRLALAMALQMPSLKRLTLIGATAGIQNSMDLSDRQRWDREQAAKIRRLGVSNFLDEWRKSIALRVVRDCQPVMENVLAQQQHSVEGLATAMVTLGRGAMPPLWKELSKLTIPVDVVYGDQDMSHRKLAMDMAKLLPKARVHAIMGCGHNAVLEAPDDIVKIIRGQH